MVLGGGTGAAGTEGAAAGLTSWAIVGNGAAAGGAGANAGGKVNGGGCTAGAVPNIGCDAGGIVAGKLGPGVDIPGPWVTVGGKV